MSAEFEAGLFPAVIKPHILSRLEDIEGTWVEYKKPQDQVVAFLSRLRIGGIKRRLVARTNSQFIIKREWPTIVDFTKSNITQSPRTLTEATTESSSPTRHIDAKARWYQKQFFPLGRFVEGEIITNDKEEIDHSDPETGLWKCKAAIVDDVLVIRRRSETLNVTAYEARALVDRYFELDAEKNLRVIQDEKHAEGTLMFFQWVLIDHDNDDARLECHFFLTRVSGPPNEKADLVQHSVTETKPQYQELVAQSQNL